MANGWGTALATESVSIVKCSGCNLSSVPSANSESAGRPGALKMNVKKWKSSATDAWERMKTRAGESVSHVHRSSALRNRWICLLPVFFRIFFFYLFICCFFIFFFWRCQRFFVGLSLPASVYSLAFIFISLCVANGAWALFIYNCVSFALSPIRICV